MKYHRDHGDDDKSYSEMLAAERALNEPTEEVETDAPAQSAEEQTYAKRYADLRRGSSQKLKEKDDLIAQLQGQLADASKAQIRFPKSETEVDEWAKKYPDVAAVVDTIAQKRAAEALAEGEKRMASLKDMEQKLTRQSAEQELLKLHPDFMQIRSNPDFHDWVAEQPSYISDALYKNSTDARAAARALDLYKSDRGIRKTRPQDAAKAVATSTTQAPKARQKPKFSESMVAAMSDAEFEKNEAAIREAMANGNFEYDVG